MTLLSSADRFINRELKISQMRHKRADKRPDANEAVKTMTAVYKAASK